MAVLALIAFIHTVIFLVGHLVNGAPIGVSDRPKKVLSAEIRKQVLAAVAKALGLLDFDQLLEGERADRSANQMCHISSGRLRLADGDCDLQRDCSTVRHLKFGLASHGNIELVSYEQCHCFYDQQAPLVELRTLLYGNIQVHQSQKFYLCTRAPCEAEVSCNLKDNLCLNNVNSFNATCQ